MASLPLKRLLLLRPFAEQYLCNRQTWSRHISSSPCLRDQVEKELLKKEDQAETKDIAISRSKQILEKEFPDHFQDGKFLTRMSYVEFIDEALARLKDLGIEKDLNAYKELLRVFPPGKFFPESTTTFGLFHAPQQLAALRVIHQMQMCGLKPDKDFERIILDAFSNRSDIWLKIIRANYWSMKSRYFDPHKLPEELPREPHKLAKIGLTRMLEDKRSVVSVTNTSRIPESVDKTWLVYSQSPSQKSIIDRLDEKSTLYLEEGGLTYVGENYLAYYHLKYYLSDEERAKKEALHQPKPDFNFNTLKVQFFGKPIRNKLEIMDDAHLIEGSYILSTGITGTSSQDSLLSWLKILQQRNPKLARLNVVFKTSRKSPELIEYGGPEEPEEPRTEEEEQAYRRRQHRQSTNMTDFVEK